MLSEDQRKKKIAYNAKLNRETLERIQIQPRKELHIAERIDAARKELSRQQYIIQAIQEKLERDAAE